MTARKVGDHIEVESEEARAGQSGTQHVRYIMAASIILVVIGFLALGFAWFGR
jgi:hypothetical protein